MPGGSLQKDKVYNFIIEQVKSNKWMPGEKIYTEKEICEKLTFSRIPLREALGDCSALGLLDKRNGAGTCVSKMDMGSILGNIIPLIPIRPSKLMDVLRFRPPHFEPGDTVEFLKPRTQDDIKKKEKTCHRRQEKFSCRGDFYSADNEFHIILARGTKNPNIIAISGMLMGVLVSAQKLVHLKMGPEVGSKCHKEMIAAIKARDSQMAALLMTRHIEATIHRIENTNSSTRNTAAVKNSRHLSSLPQWGVSSI